MKKVIVQIVQHLEMGGIECLVLEFKRLLDDDYDVHIVSLEGENGHKSQLWPRLQALGTNVHFLNKKPGLQVTLIWQLKNILGKLNTEIVHTHHIGPLLYGGIAARLARVPQIIHTEHDAWHLAVRKRRLVQHMAIKIVKPVLVADAEIVAQEMQHAFPGIMPFIIRNGVDLNKFVPGHMSYARKLIGLPETVRIIGCGARLVSEKSHNTLIKAVSLLSKNTHLALAGDGPLKRELQQYAESLGLANRVHFLGNIESMKTFYQSLDVFAMSSKHEGMPVSPLEAQACNVPVVLTNVGGTKEVVCPRSGKLVSVDCIEELAFALAYVLETGNFFSPRRFVEQTADINCTVSKYLELTVSDNRRKCYG